MRTDFILTQVVVEMITVLLQEREFFFKLDITFRGGGERRSAPWTCVLCARMECIGHRSRFVHPIRTVPFACDGQNDSAVRSSPYSAAEYTGPGRRPAASPSRKK